VLIGLSISQFTIIQHLNIDFDAGMTAITGETGAGKSIALDALSLALGERAESSQVRHGADRADIRAVFDVRQLKHIQQWLTEHEFGDHDECILRRVISADGRSKAFINDAPVNLQTLKSLGGMLVDIHSQHAHHQLLQRDYHQVLLDAYSGNSPLLKEVGHFYHEWQHSQKRIHQLQAQAQEADKRKEYIAFQLQEFHELQLQAGEFERLEQEHKVLANTEALQSACEQTLLLCRDNESSSILEQLQHCEHILAPLDQHSSLVKEARELISSATINIQEACASLRHQLNSQGDAARLNEIEERLASILNLARKHRCKPIELSALFSSLESELLSISQNDELITTLEAEAEQQLNQYTLNADKLSKQRQKAAKSISTDIKNQLSALGMNNCEFSVALNTDTSSKKANGFESIEFLVSTNPGQPAQGLHKIASGGELSRISLAIQVITAKSSTIPTLVFDEVDVGIGGATAEVVGRLLRSLSASAQILCITHQAQVAAQAQQHYVVEKSQSDKQTETSVSVLNKADRVKEVARMMGGVEITAATLKLAKEMLVHS